jgi:hypothetical protein
MPDEDLDDDTNTNQQTESQQVSQQAREHAHDSNSEFQATGSRVQYGESVTDIISRPDTSPVIKQTVGIFAAIGVGIGILVYLAVNSFSSGTLGSITGGLITIVAVIFCAVLGPVIASFTSIRAIGFLPQLKDDLAYATGVVGTGVGQLILLTITIFAATLPTSGGGSLGFGDFVNILIISAVATSIVGALSMYVLKKLPDPQKQDVNT